MDASDHERLGAAVARLVEPAFSPYGFTPHAREHARVLLTQAVHGYEPARELGQQLEAAVAEALEPDAYAQLVVLTHSQARLLREVLAHLEADEDPRALEVVPAAYRAIREKVPEL